MSGQSSADRTPGHARRPRVFRADDPEIVRDAPAAEPSSEEPRGAPTPMPPARPTLDGFGRGVRWGAILVSALLAATILALGLWFMRFVSVALARDDWIGWTMLVILSAAALAALVLVMRELVGFLRLSHLGRLQRDIADVLMSRDVAEERRIVGRLTGLYASRPELAWQVRRLSEHARDVHDAGALLRLADRELLTPMDAEARRLITRGAKRVATVTALSPMALIAVTFVLYENLRVLRALATHYGGRPGALGSLRLARMVFTHIVATGGIAVTDDLLGQFVGQDVLRRLSRRLGEGAFNGALTGRIGVAAIEVVRPLPFIEARPVRVRDVLGEILRGSAPGTTRARARERE